MEKEGILDDKVIPDLIKDDLNIKAANKIRLNETINE